MPGSCNCTLVDAILDLWKTIPELQDVIPHTSDPKTNRLFEDESSKEYSAYGTIRDLGFTSTINSNTGSRRSFGGERQLRIRVHFGIGFKKSVGNEILVTLTKTLHRATQFDTIWGHVKHLTLNQEVADAVLYEGQRTYQQIYTARTSREL